MKSPYLRVRLAVGGLFLAIAAGLLSGPWSPTLSTVSVVVTAALATGLLPYVIIDELRKRPVAKAFPYRLCPWGCARFVHEDDLADELAAHAMTWTIVDDSESETAQVYLWPYLWCECCMRYVHEDEVTDHAAEVSS